MPIYWLNGAKAADEYEDFYDGSWDDEANDKNESGTDGPDTSLAVNWPITGCDHDGTEAFTSSNVRRRLEPSWSASVIPTTPLAVTVPSAPPTSEST